MTHSARRILRQGIPLAVLILSIGLARQYAAGGGVFETGGGLIAKAQAAFGELRTKLLPEAAPVEEPAAEPTALSANALETVLAEQPTVVAPQFEPFPRRNFGFSYSPPAHCRH
jgi:hypothetical protein